MRDCLLVYGYDIRVAYDGLAGWQQLQLHMPDLVLVDLGMPAMDGYEFCRRLRNSPEAHRAGLIVVSGQDQFDKISELNVDDYLCKPCKAAELRFRVETRLRSAQPAPPNGTPGLAHLPKERLCHVPGRPLPARLSDQENAVLARLLASPCRPLTESTLATAMLGHTPKDYKYAGLRRAIMRLRQKLGLDHGGQAYIRTVPGLGYMVVPHGGKAPSAPCFARSNTPCQVAAELASGCPCQGCPFAQQPRGLDLADAM